MIRLERDPTFWVGVAQHPAVSATLMGLAPEGIGALIGHPQVTPLAAEHGGFLFTRLDALGFVFEFHTLFTPEGWGREVLAAAKDAVEVMFDMTNCRVLSTYEMADNPRSQPPRSFGFEAQGGFSETEVGTVRPWLLTRDRWAASPACKRMRRCR